MPFVARRFGAPDAVAGALLTTTALCATLSSPLWGALGDRYGRKRALLGSQGCSFAAYLLLASAGGLPLLFVSRVVEGLGGGNLGVATSYIADVTTPQQRPQALALATAAFGGGFIAGPVIGGALAHLGYTVPFAFAAGLQAANMALTATLLPQSQAPQQRRRFRWAELRALAATRAVESVMARRFLYIFAFTYFFTSFSLFASDVLHAGPETSSLLLALAGAVGAVAQVAAVGPLVARLGLRRTALGAFAIGIVAYALLGVVTTLVAFAAVVALWAFGGSVLRPALDARIAELATPTSRGTLLGFGDALDNFAMIFAPTLGAAIVGAAPRFTGVLPALALAGGLGLTARERGAPERLSAERRAGR